jgi:hypothetical protein
MMVHGFVILDATGFSMISGILPPRSPLAFVAFSSYAHLQALREINFNLSSC